MAGDVVQNGEAILRKEARVEPGGPNVQSANSCAEARVQPSMRRRRHGYLLRICFVTVILVLLATGLVPLGDVLFACFASVYFYLFGKFVYPSPSKVQRPASLFPNHRTLVSSYVAFAGVISIPVPALYILGCYLKGDQASVTSASPHLFLMTCQVVTEIVVVSVSSTPVSLPVRAFVPIVYNTRRLFTLGVWLETEMRRSAVDVDTDGLRWLLFGRGLAAVNMALWTFNLLCVMLPVYNPMVMRQHYELERQEFVSRSEKRH